MGKKERKTMNINPWLELKKWLNNYKKNVYVYMVELL